MNKKKLLIIICLILVVIILTVVTVIVVRSINGGNNNVVNNGGNNGEVTQNIKVTGKLQEYIKGFTNNYYIKYSGKFKNNSGEFVNAIVEYTKKGEDYALRASGLDMHLICEGTKLYSVSHSYKMIVQMNKESFNISEYNLASDIGQTFVKSYKETKNGTQYDVEEYTYNGNTLKYYFKESDIKIINYNLQDIQIIRVEKNTNSTLFAKPEGYSNV